MRMKADLIEAPKLAGVKIADDPYIGKACQNATFKKRQECQKPILSSNNCPWSRRFDPPDRSSRHSLRSTEDQKDRCYSSSSPKSGRSKY